MPVYSTIIDPQMGLDPYEYPTDPLNGIPDLDVHSEV